MIGDGVEHDLSATAATGHHADDQGTTEIVRVFGRAGTPAGYEIRDFLGRSVVEFAWVELGSDSDARDLAGVASLGDARLPVCVLPDGTRVEAATPRAIAGRLGWLTAPSAREYDLSIYGAGPAGLSAAVYAASEGLRCVIVERKAVGGQAGTSSLIENYLGFPGGISGAHLAERARQQAVAFGAEILLLQEGVKAVFRDDRIVVDLADGTSLTARANVCATGVEWNRLGLPGEDRLEGAGLYYGAGVSEAPMCSGQDVYVIGGGNSAGQAVVHLAAYARKVVLLIRDARPAASMSSYLLARIVETPNVEIRTSTRVTGLVGDKSLEGLALNSDAGQEQVATGSAFVLIGGRPHTEWASDTAIVRDHAGYLVTGPDLLDAGAPPACWPLKRHPYHLETSVPGSFAAGDVRSGSVKRIASGVGEGAMAVQLVHRYLAETG